MRHPHRPPPLNPPRSPFTKGEANPSNGLGQPVVLKVVLTKRLAPQADAPTSSLRAGLRFAGFPYLLHLHLGLLDFADIE
jgi:hypothetical protein